MSSFLFPGLRIVYDGSPLLQGNMLVYGGYYENLEKIDKVGLIRYLCGMTDIIIHC